MYISSEQKYAYKLLHDAYYGSGLFSLGRGLKQHPRENLDNYNFRKALSSHRCIRGIHQWSEYHILRYTGT